MVLNLNEKAKIPDPERLVQVYNQSASTNEIYFERFAQGGPLTYNQCHQNGTWTFWIPVLRAVVFISVREKLMMLCSLCEACGIGPRFLARLKETEFYTIPEALLLAMWAGGLLVQDSFELVIGLIVLRNMLWIGDRTRQLRWGAMFEFLRGVSKNPNWCIKQAPQWILNDFGGVLCECINTLTMSRGRLICNCSYGGWQSWERNAYWFKPFKKEGKNWVWSSDPMQWEHG